MKLLQATQYFAWPEIACRRTQTVWIPRTQEEVHFFVQTLQGADALREAFGHPLVVRSGHRSPEWNMAVGGAEYSFHLKIALDLAPRMGDFADPDAFQEALDRLEALAVEGVFSGIGRYASFVHVDCRALLGHPATRWADRTAWSPV